MNDIFLPSQVQPARVGIDPMLASAPARRHFSSSPRDLLFVLFWHRRKVIAFFIIASLLTALAILLMPSTYRSESTLLVKIGSDSISPDVSASLGGPMLQPVMVWEVQMKTELEVLKSREIAQAVVNKVGVGRVLRKGSAGSVPGDDTANRQALTLLQQNLELAVVPDSSVLQIAYESGDSRLAKDIVAAYVDQYLELRTRVHASAAGAKFLTGELRDSVAEVQELENQIRRIKDEAGIGDIGETRQILQQRIGAMQSEAAAAQAAAIGGSAESKKIEERLKEIPERVISQQTIDQAMNWVDEQKKAIAKLEQDLADARARFVESSPQVSILQSKLTSARQLLTEASKADGERIETLNPIYQDLQRRLEEARTNTAVAGAKEAAIRAEITKAEATLKSTNEVEQKIKNLMRAAGLKEDALKVVSQAHDRAALLSALQDQKLNNVSIVQPATTPLRPVAPNRLMLLVLGMFVAGSGAIGLAIISETLSKTTKRPEDIDRTCNLPSVSVPVVDAGSYVHEKGLPTAGGLFGKLLPGSTASSQTLVRRVKDSNSGLAHTSGTNGDIRPVRRWSPQLLHAAHGIIDGLLFDAIRDRKSQQAFTTGIISCRPGQGASTLSAYIASAIADRLESSLPRHPDDRMLLVDCDLEEPTLHRLMSVEDSPGLGDWIAQDDLAGLTLAEFTHATSHSRLHVMPAGRASVLTRVLDRVDVLITQATGKFRHVVLDLPPVSTSPTVLRLAAKCDAVVVVVECGNMHQEVVRRSVRALQSAGANVVGVILNKRRFPIPDWLYDRAA